MSQIHEVLGRLEFQKQRLAEVKEDPKGVAKVLYEVIDTMEQLAGIVKNKQSLFGT